MAEEKESPISICQVVQNPKKGDCNKSSNFIISTTRASWKRGLKWCQPEACWTSLRGEIRSMITSPPSNWLMTFLQWIQRPCPTKIPQINFTRFYWKFVVSTIILNSLVQEVEADDPTLPKRHWTGEIWTQFLKIDFSLEKCNSSHISSP